MVAQKISSSYLKSICIFNEKLYVIPQSPAWNDPAHEPAQRHSLDATALAARLAARACRVIDNCY
jgi:hypothetical protein